MAVYNQLTGGSDSSTVFYVSASNDRRFVGQKFDTGHTLVGKEISEITLYMKRNGVNDVYKLAKLSSSDLRTDLEAVDLSYSGFASNMTSYIAYTFSGFTNFTLGAGEKIGIFADGVSGGNSGDWIKLEEASNPDSNTEVYILDNSPVDGGSSTSNPDLKFSITYTAIEDQQVKVWFYPDNNVQDAIEDQQVKVWFYPDNNVQAKDQQVKVWFYPNNNVNPPETAWKWWLGMRGKKRYGKGHIRRMRI